MASVPPRAPASLGPQADELELLHVTPDQQPFQMRTEAGQGRVQRHGGLPDGSARPATYPKWWTTPSMGVGSGHGGQGLVVRERQRLRPGFPSRVRVSAR